MIIIYKRSWLFMLLFLFASCRKDSSNAGCQNISAPTNYTYGPNPALAYFYLAPYFNPNNGQEFAMEISDSSGTNSLAIYNLQTGALKTVYTSSNITDPPKWSVNDWLVFTQGFSLYKIKSNGDSLTQLLQPNSVFEPAWNFDGTRITYNTVGTVYEVIITDENGILQEQLNNVTSIGVDWSQPNHLIASGNFSQIILINDTSYQINNVNEAGSTTDNGIAWIDNENLLYINYTTAGGDIYKVNINTQVSQLVKQGCNAKMFSSISVSPDQQKIIAQTLEVTVNNTTHAIYTSTGVYTMNIDGSGETKINLPQ